WTVASPDLSGADANAKDCADAQNSLAAAKACGFGVIFTIAPSPKDSGTIWVGTDDGQVQLTTDGGKHWRNVTPPAMPLWGKVNDIAPSPFDADTAYVAVDTHRLGEHRPVIFRTTDAGAHWQTITAGLPADEFVQTVVADSGRRGLLFAGSDRSVYVSFSDGDGWQPLSLNLPTTSIRSLTIHGDDLVAATMGRGFWSLDDIEPLREGTANIAASPAHLFAPAVAIRLRASENRDTPPPPSEPRAKNPPTGAIIDYWLKDATSGPVTLTISDSSGHVLRQFSSAAKPERLDADRYFEKSWVGAPETLSAAAGAHRFVWNLRWPRPPAISYQYSISAVWPGDTPLVPQGALALPGKYTMTLTVDGKRYTQPLTIKMDPRVDVGEQALAANLALENKISADLARAIAAYDASGATLSELKQHGGNAAQVKALEAWRDTDENSLANVAGVLDTLATNLEMADAAPTAGQRAVYAAYSQKLDALLTHRPKPGS
ncbi:MAG TPA: glycoside hydrolase, partial [Gammaproteobacteria bacterium]|nr:glycoside hydrolase [Gammaproteobacteria bacterium]